MEHCAATTNHLADIFTEEDYIAADPPEFQGDLVEAVDMTLLMQLEGGEGPAADAVTLLLQLQRDIEMNIAA